MVGKSFDATARLSAQAIHSWTFIDGHYSGQGVDLLTLPFNRFLNVIQTWTLERIDDDDRETWLAKLDTPIPGRRRYSQTEDKFDDINQIKNLG